MEALMAQQLANMGPYGGVGGNDGIRLQEEREAIGQARAAEAIAIRLGSTRGDGAHPIEGRAVVIHVLALKVDDLGH